jgi:multiple sugar transport system permease protein
MQEAMARVPDARGSLSALAPITRGAEVVPGDSTGPAAWRRRLNGVSHAAVAVRLAPGRWAELRVVPAETGSGGWLPVTLGLALLGPCAAAFAAWGARMAAQPRRRRETVTAWAFLSPSLVHMAVFSFAPILFAFYLAMHRWSLVEPVRPFVGVVNFTRILHDPLVWISLRNTALYVLYVPVSAAIALGVALVTSRSTRGVRALRTVFFLPYVSSVVAVTLVWQWMYHADFGVINYLLSFVHVRPVDWLGNPKTALLAVMVVSVWVQFGYQMTVFLAGLNGIPQTYLDAARVDGAGAWQRFWRVTFPLLRPVTLFVIVTGVIGSFQVFTYVYMLTDGGPLHATDVLAYRIYQTAWELLQFGYASALAVLLFVVLFAVTRAQFRLLGRRVEYV